MKGKLDCPVCKGYGTIMVETHASDDKETQYLPAECTVGTSGGVLYVGTKSDTDSAHDEAGRTPETTRINRVLPQEIAA